MNSGDVRDKIPTVASKGNCRCPAAKSFFIISMQCDSPSFDFFRRDLTGAIFLFVRTYLPSRHL
jgi:hypothetical protein